MALLELILNLIRASDCTDISTLELEAIMLSQNNGHQSPSDMVLHPRWSETQTQMFTGMFTCHWTLSEPVKLSSHQQLCLPNGISGGHYCS